MTIPAGTQVYDVSSDPVVALGITYTDSELDQSITGGVVDALCDTTGKDELAAMLSGISDTEFGESVINGILDSEVDPEDWRVGETIAEVYLQDHRNCEFPWPSSRDLKNPTASPAGTDMVGFQLIGDNDFRFAYGEVKASYEKNCPPSVMKNEHGMRNQLRGLVQDTYIKNNLLEYMGHRAVQASTTWQDKYKQAAKRYLRNPDDVSLFGVLIRDVNPDEKDLRSCAKALVTDCKAPTSMELRALYLPHGALDPGGKATSLSKRVKQSKGGDDS